MISDNIDWKSRSFKVMMPDSECFENSKKFLVVGIIVEFGGSKGSRMECNGVNISIGVDD